MSCTFNNCVNLKELIIPNLKTCFGIHLYRPFENCLSLKKVKSSDLQIKLVSKDICFIY